jgi:hypothetical protein
MAIISAREAIELSRSRGKPLSIPWGIQLAADLEYEADELAFSVDERGTVHGFIGDGWQVNLLKAKGE